MRTVKFENIFFRTENAVLGYKTQIVDIKRLLGDNVRIIFTGKTLSEGKYGEKGSIKRIEADCGGDRNCRITALTLFISTHLSTPTAIMKYSGVRQRKNGHSMTDTPHIISKLCSTKHPIMEK
jgi:hypothetical protein